MTIAHALMSLMLVITPGLCAQTNQVKKEEKQNTTRGRRADEATSPNTLTDSQGNPKTPSSTPTVDQEKKTTDLKEVAANPENPRPVDIFTELRNKIDNAAATDSERISLRLQLAEEFIKAGRKPEALSELGSISGMDVFDPQGFYNTGNAFARLGETGSAIETYRKAIDQRKGNYSRAFNNLGVVLLRVGRWDDAQDALLSAIKLENFRYAEASYNLGRLYAAQGQNDLAAREWRRTLSIDPKHTAAAEALRSLGSGDRVVVASNPKTLTAPKVEKIAGNSVGMSGNQTLVLDQTSFDFLQRAREANEKGNSLQAIANYKRVLSRQAGYFAPANLELSFALLSLKRFDEALSNLQLVASKDGSRFPISYYHVGRLYEIKSELKQAEAWYSQAATSFGTQNPQFLLDVSRVREQQGNYKGALDSMERYLSLMQQKGEEPSWSNERLTALRQKAVAVPKN